MAPTCFYDQAPLFRALESHPKIDLTVYVCTEEALNGSDISSKFANMGDCAVPGNMLNGYKRRFLRNYTPFPSYPTSGVGINNIGIWNEFQRDIRDAVILMSWMIPTWWLAILACLKCKIPLLYMPHQTSNEIWWGTVESSVEKDCPWEIIVSSYRGAFYLQENPIVSLTDTMAYPHENSFLRIFVGGTEH